MEITFLGTGTSHGVPALDCLIEDYLRCSKGVCKRALKDPRHARTRSSILVAWGGHSVLIDVSMDFRQQALRESVRQIDAVLVTHGHADHIGGIPDIRSYTKGTPLQFFGSDETLDTIKSTYSYIFDPSTFVGGGIPRMELRATDGPFELFGQQIVPVRVKHGSLSKCYGYRIGPVGYIPDLKSIADEEIDKLAGVEVLILNCLRELREHASHLILAQSMELARRVAPSRCYFTHMCHDIDYEQDSAKLDSWMSFAHDGLRVRTGT